MLGNVAFFGSYYNAKDFLIRHELVHGEKTLTCIAGGCAGIGYWLLIYPFDACKSIIQAQSLSAKDPYKGNSIAL